MKNEKKNRDWVKWLSENLEFPFEVKRVDDGDEYVLYGKSADDEPFRLGHIFKVISIDDLDESYGLILKCREGRRIGHVPLLDLELTDKKQNNYQLINEFLEWYSENYG